jgi:hypothetical protein
MRQHAKHHLSLRGVKTAVPVVTGMQLRARSPDSCVCEACILGKPFRQPFKRIDKLKATARLQVVHSDVMGPMRTTNMSGKRHAISLTDEFTRYVTVYFIASKSEAAAMFGKYKAEGKNQCNTKIERRGRRIFLRPVPQISGVRGNHWHIRTLGTKPGIEHMRTF